MRSTSLPFALLLTAPWLLPGCRPSKADVAGIEAQLGEIRAQQDELAERMEQLEERDADGRAQAKGQRSALESAVVDLSKRLTTLETKAVERPRPSQPDPAAVYRVTLGDSHAKGPPDALVTIVMWTDYQCPYCARVQNTLRELESEYGREVRFVHKHNPLGFHPRAMPAALAVEAAARQGKFWEMHDMLFEHQKELDDKDLRRFAKKLGLKVKRFDEDREDPKLRKRVTEEQSQGMTLGARGTPAFFVNGRFLSGAQPFESFKALIDEELGKARTLVDRGVRREDVYQVTIAEGRSSV